MQTVQKAIEILAWFFMNHDMGHVFDCFKKLFIMGINFKVHWGIFLRLKTILTFPNTLFNEQ